MFHLGIFKEKRNVFNTNNSERKVVPTEIFFGLKFKDQTVLSIKFIRWEYWKSRPLSAGDFLLGATFLGSRSMKKIRRGNMVLLIIKNLYKKEINYLKGEKYVVFLHRYHKIYYFTITSFTEFNLCSIKCKSFSIWHLYLAHDFFLGTAPLGDAH